MKRRNQDFLLGLTAIVMLGLFMGTFIFLYDPLPADTRPLLVHFRHREGMVPLPPGAAVLLANSLNVGRVTEVSYQQLETAEGLDTFIVVEAVVDEKLRLYRNCKINTNQPAVGGNGYLNIQSLGTPDAFSLAKDDVVRGGPPESLAAAISGLSARVLAEGGLMDKVEGLLDPDAEGSLVFKFSQSLADVNAITSQLRVQLSPDEEATLLRKLNGILDSVNSMTVLLRAQLDAGDGASAISKVHIALDELGGSVGTVNEILRENKPVLADALVNVQETTQTLNEKIVGQLGREFDRDDPSALLGKLHAALDSTQRSLGEIEGLSASARRLVVLAEPSVASTLDNINEMSAELRRAGAELRLNPSKLIWGPEPAEKGRLPVFDAARQFAEAATALDNVSARYKALLDSASAGGPVDPQTQARLREMGRELEDAFGRLNRAEKFFYDQMQRPSR